MLGYYIYYKVDPARFDLTRAAVSRVLDAIAREAGVSGRLMARTDDRLTWMEIYEPIADRAAFDAALDRAVGSAGLLALLPGGRRITERFESIALASN